MQFLEYTDPVVVPVTFHGCSKHKISNYSSYITFTPGTSPTSREKSAHERQNACCPVTGSHIYAKSPLEEDEFYSCDISTLNPVTTASLDIETLSCAATMFRADCHGSHVDRIPDECGLGQGKHCKTGQLTSSICTIGQVQCSDII
jgi:hypothetical protein